MRIRNYEKNTKDKNNNKNMEFVQKRNKENDVCTCSTDNNAVCGTTFLHELDLRTVMLTVAALAKYLVDMFAQ